MAELGYEEGTNFVFELASKSAWVGSLAVEFHTGLLKLSPGCAAILGPLIIVRLVAKLGTD
jgi:hypothetical protein